ncbi:hypothetical protein BD779DRAFT_1494189 [Infundibulicybe gibba]|nr:hypothetical protein BD779DRAFT_1538079 [Infundibulicybe gibba]KAF8896142.1 hypothetical protein BD779DRAFT_1494189 [Infundibulicybe gibba]
MLPPTPSESTLQLANPFYSQPLSAIAFSDTPSAHSHHLALPTASPAYHNHSLPNPALLVARRALNRGTSFPLFQ